MFIFINDVKCIIHAKIIASHDPKKMINSDKDQETGPPLPL